jgi:hypothetical protein
MRYGRRSGTAPTRFRITSLNRHSCGALYAMRPGSGRAGVPLFHLLYFPKTRPVANHTSANVPASRISRRLSGAPEAMRRSCQAGAIHT